MFGSPTPHVSYFMANDKKILESTNSVEDSYKCFENYDLIFHFDSSS